MGKGLTDPRRRRVQHQCGLSIKFDSKLAFAHKAIYGNPCNQMNVFVLLNLRNTFENLGPFFFAEPAQRVLTNVADLLQFLLLRLCCTGTPCVAKTMPRQLREPRKRAQLTRGEHSTWMRA